RTVNSSNPSNGSAARTRFTCPKPLPLGEAGTAAARLRRRVRVAILRPSPYPLPEGEGRKRFLSNMDHLTAYEKVQLARHPQRPYFLDYVEHLCPDFIELHGDRKFADDAAMVTGFGTLRAIPVCLIGHQKGRDTKQRQ